MSRLADVLALEHEAVWTYGLIGGAVPALSQRAYEAFTAHRKERDRLIAAVAEDVPPQASYAPATVADEAEALERAQGIEARIGAAWAILAGSTTGKDRDDALTRLVTAETARLDWGGTPVAFPGLDA
ncbi:MAG: DUF4439 domain-containing protein [Aeromicrobium sp.]|uniref:DUF4439 domain-containing protein n=1 Tax=Aeromicrobium sp. TaxID=1871063 RepID=UPI0039E2F6E6